MKYWWHAVKFGGEIILLTPEEATEGMAAKTNGKPFMVPRLQMMIDSKEIAEFERSDTGLNDKGLLSDGSQANPLKRELPETNATGGILTQWVKFLVKDNKVAAFIAQPGYYALRRDDRFGGVFIAHSRPVFASGLPEGLEQLEGWENDILAKRLSDKPGWWNS